MSESQNTPLPEKINVISFLVRIRSISAKLFASYFGPEGIIEGNGASEVNQLLQKLEPDVRVLQQLVVSNFQMKQEVPIDFRLAIDAVLRLGSAFDRFVAAQNSLKSASPKAASSAQNELVNCRRDLMHALALVINATQFSKIIDK